MEYIFLLGAVQGLLLTFFLLSKKENFLANRIFALTIFAYSIDILYAFYFLKKIYLIYPQLIGFSVFLPFIYSPSVFLYAVYVSRKYHSFKKTDFLHFLPCAIIFIFGFHFLFLINPSEKLNILNPNIAKSFIVVFIRTLIPFYGIAYTILTLVEVKKYHRKLKDQFSNIGKLRLNWLIYLLVGIICTWILEFIQIVLIEGFHSPEAIIYNYIYIFISIFMYAVSFKSLSQPEIFIDNDLNIDSLNKEPEAEEKPAVYKKSGLSDEKAKSYLNNLLELMNGKKPFLQPSLTLNELAEQLNISTHNLSETLNTQLNQSFYDFVNSYRVDEVKRLMQEDVNAAYSILSIALDAGFNSKSSFNNVFKKQTGMTPSEYRESIKK